MANKNQSTDADNGEKAAGTAKLAMGVRESGASAGLRTGADGQTNDSKANRNKKS